MERGDISNVSAQRVVMVFEGTIGTLTKTAEAKRRFHLRLHQWKRAAQCWTVEPFMVKVLVDWAWRSPYNVDLATYLDPDEAEHIEERLNRLAVPFGNFYFTTIEEMTRGIINRPDVAAVFDFDPARSFTYGSKGRAVIGL